MTRAMVDASLSARMPAGATLLDTARGALANRDALAAELRTGRIRAVLDVTESEVRCRRSGSPVVRADPCVRCPVRTSPHEEIDMSKEMDPS
ncbi:NAD(P)-dependent oxidoreductase [Streptomyces sp. NPDC050508]|uniref:NAD(P)-dependent oxidoreductase n=1 Tax=Streptomyces sp. NPDC050508 TaxID=3155405 RepID=UPI00343F29AC